MKQIIWVLVNKNTGKPVPIWVDEWDGLDIFAVGFSTRKGLLKKIVSVEYDEEIRKVELRCNDDYSD